MEQHKDEQYSAAEQQYRADFEHTRRQHLGAQLRRFGVTHSYAKFEVVSKY